MVCKVQIDNFCLTYYLDGNPNHPVILFLHGFMGDRNEFQKAITSLSEQFYCVAIDLLGHGQTTCIAIQNQEYYYTIQSSAKFIIKFLDFLRVDRCFLVGYSMGGRLALYLTIHFPEYFHKVVLESTSAGLRTTNEKSDRLAKDQKLAAELEKIDFKTFLENWYQQSIFDSLRSHPLFLQMMEQRLHNSPLDLAKSLRNFSLGMQPSLWGKLADNKIPLLLLVGALDPKFVQINQQMEQICKYAKLEIISSCGHNIHFENPDLFIEKIKLFITYSCRQSC